MSRLTKDLLGVTLQILGAMILFGAGIASLFTLGFAKAGAISVYSILIIGAIIIISMLAGSICYGFGADLTQPTADEILAKDLRPLVLYLRSFEFDKAASKNLGSPLPIQDAALGLAAQTVTQKNYEQTLKEILTNVGPCIAVGQPGYELPILGFARKKLPMETWEDEVINFMKQSALVIICSGNTKGVLWELERTKANVPLERILILIVRETSNKWWLEAERIFNQKIPNFITYDDQSLHGLIYFDDQGIAQDKLLIPFEKGLIQEILSPIFKRLVNLPPIQRNIELGK
jgi:hypothetical protein